MTLHLDLVYRLTPRTAVFIVLIHTLANFADIVGERLSDRSIAEVTITGDENKEPYMLALDECRRQLKSRLKELAQ